MREDRFDDRFELDLREAMRLELASVRVGVAAPQIRGRLAARQRTRRTTQLVLLAAALAIGLIGGLALAGRVITAPTSAEPATVAAIDETSGDLVLSRAWPDGRVEEAARYAGAVRLLRASTGDVAASDLPQDAVAVAGPVGRLAIGLPTGDVLVFPGPDDGREPFATTAAPGATGDSAWPYIGWDDHGRLVVVSLRGNVRLVDAATGDEAATALPESVMPVLVRGGPQPLAWTGDGMMSAQRQIPSEFQSELGTVDLAADPPAFVPGPPAAVRAATGLEPRYAVDDTGPRTGCWDDGTTSGCALITPRSSNEGTSRVVAWYLPGPSEHITDVVRTADGRGLLVVVRAANEERGRLVVVDEPGSWRDAVTFDAPAPDPAAADASPHLLGASPGGRSVVLWAPGGPVVADLATGAATTLPEGTLFVGWPAVPDVATDSLPTMPACQPAVPEDAASAALSAAGSTSPAAAGARPVVGDRGDADPWRLDELATVDPVVVEAGSQLALALPAGTCAEAVLAEVVPSEGASSAVPGQVRAWPAAGDDIGGLVPIAAPESGGDWILRVKLWLTGADREAILLYRITTQSPAKPVVTPEPASTEP